MYLFWKAFKQTGGICQSLLIHIPTIMKSVLSIIALSLMTFACQQTEVINEPLPTTSVAAKTAAMPFTSYSIAGSNIQYNQTNTQLIGANAFHSFGAGGNDMKAWKLNIAREFVGNVKENPLSGWPIKDSNGSWLHSLQTVVDSNRLGNRVTVLCPFRWNGQSATDFTGKRPNQTAWWADFKIKLGQWATQFKNQPDVWIELWNEPYRYDRADGYTDNIWVADMTELVSIIRNTGNNNIVLVPCAEQGQNESVLNNKGAAFLKGKNNILFDIHAYEKWLLVSNTSIDTRLQKLKTNNLPIFFGEVAPMNAGTLMNPSYFLNAAYNRGLSLTAWVWKYDGNDKDALLNAQGLPNDNANNNWGTTFKTLSLQTRK
jgi:mannan endo-1,4-beta-mannosidase